MIFTNKSVQHDFTLHISDDVITLVDSARFLGVIIDSKLKFSFHIDLLAGKASRIVGVIRKVIHVLLILIICAPSIFLFFIQFISTLSQFGVVLYI